MTQIILSSKAKFLLVFIDTANDELQAAIQLSLQESQQAEAEERELHRYPTCSQSLK